MIENEKMKNSNIKPLFQNSEIIKNKKVLKKSRNLEVIPADGNIWVQDKPFSGLYILRKILGIIKCFNQETGECCTRFVVVVWDYEDEMKLEQSAMVFVDSYTGVILEGYLVDNKPDAILLDTAKEILKINYSNLFFASINKLQKLFQINKPYLEE